MGVIMTYKERLEVKRAEYISEAMKPGVFGAEFQMWAQAVDWIDHQLNK